MVRCVHAFQCSTGGLASLGRQMGWTYRLTDTHYENSTKMTSPVWFTKAFQSGRLRIKTVLIMTSAVRFVQAFRSGAGSLTLLGRWTGWTCGLTDTHNQI